MFRAKWAGVDPGANGGLAFIYEDGSCVAYPMPMIDKEVNHADLIKIFQTHKPEITTVELVGAIANGSRKSAFQFGKVYGAVVAHANAYSDTVYLVRPKVWQKAIYGYTSSDKELGANYCKTNYPNTPIVLPRCRKFHDGITDAICIAAYCKKTN